MNKELLCEDLLKAKEQLETDGFTCVLKRGESVYTSRDRGVKPLMQCLEKYEKLCGYCAADKVVGRAAAFLYVLLQVHSVYAQIISEPALEVFTQYGVQVEYDQKVAAIRNRTNTGYCPMEQATWDCRTPEEALAKVKETLMKLANSQ